MKNILLAVCLFTTSICAIAETTYNSEGSWSQTDSNGTTYNSDNSWSQSTY